jgi:hypothetical protein
LFTSLLSSAGADPYIITTMIELEVVHTVLFQEGCFLSRVGILFEGEEVY